MAGSDDDIPPPPPPQTQTPTQQAPHIVSTIKLPILKKGEYDIWVMKIEHYLAFTDYPIWEVIQRGNGPVSVSTDTNGVIKVLPPKTAKEILAGERERKARTTLLMVLLEDHLAKFHKMTNAKEMWEAIKSRFGGNDESKKMQKYILKQQFESFSVSNSEGLHKGYDRSLPSAWSQVSLIMRTKPGVDSLSFDDMYNNLRVFESNVKGSTASSSSTQNVAFVSENTSSTNDLDEFDLEEIDLKWQVAMISIRMNKFYKKTGHFAREYGSKGNQDSRRRDAWNTGNKDKDNGRRSGKQEEPKALVTLDGDGVDWTSHSEDEQENYALMAYSNSGSDTDVTSCSKECKESYGKLKKLYDEQREKLGDVSIEIQAYTQALKKVEAQLVAHKQNQLWYELKPIIEEWESDSEDDEIVVNHKELSCASDVENKSRIHTIHPRFYSTDAKKKKLDTPDHIIRALKDICRANNWYTKIKNEEIEIGPVDIEWNKSIGNRMKKQRSGYKRDDVVLLDVITVAIRDAYEKKLIQVLKIHTDDIVALVKGRQDDLLYSLYGMFSAQKDLDNGDGFHRVIWVLESNWREL
ncbi:hypothetical protein Tco_1218155 [Tanacetum coccineum]